MPFSINAPPGAVETNGAETVPVLTIEVPESSAMRIKMDITAYEGTDDVFSATLDCFVYRNGAADVVLVNQALDPKWSLNDGSNLQAEAVADGTAVRVDITGLAGKVFRWAPDGYGSYVQ